MRLVECLALTNLNPTLLALHMAHLPPSSLPFPATFPAISPRRSTLLVAGVPPLRPKKLTGVSLPRNHKLSVVCSAASREESSTEGEIEMEKNNIDQAGQASQEAWQQVLASFKEQALKLQSVSQEAYEAYSKKAVVVLKETSETLKIQADQAREDLMVMAKELGEDSKQFLTVAAENSPEPVKDVVETFASAEGLNDVSNFQDFYIGIPYGTLLSAGGFLNFMITGSVSAIRFGVILGGILLALSISSLRSWRKGESTEMTLKGQAAIASILFLRDMRLVFQGLTLVGLLKTIVSGAVAAFFIYRVTYVKPQRPTIDGEANN